MEEEEMREEDAKRTKQEEEHWRHETELKRIQEEEISKSLFTDPKEANISEIIQIIRMVPNIKYVRK